MTLTPYFNFAGNAEEAMTFYRSVFGGEFSSLQRYGDMPGGDKLPPGDRQKIMHVSLPIRDGSVLMASDALQSRNQKVTLGNNVYLSIDATSKDDADRLFVGLSAGGTVEMPLQDTFWGAYFGMFADRFGIHWMVNHTYPQK